MKMFKSADYQRIQNPNPEQPYGPEILMAEHGARRLGGMFGLLPPGTRVPYHHHVHRESIIIALSGKAVEVIDEKETPIEAGDILFIPAGEGHATINRSEEDFRYLEYFTSPPLTWDFVAGK